MLLLLIARVFAWTVEVEETIVVSDLDLWTSEIPSLVVDRNGVPWLGFTTRYEGERYCTAGVAHRSASGWSLRKDVAEGAWRAVLAVDPAGEVVVFAGTPERTSVFQVGLDYSEVAVLPGGVRSAPRADLAYGTIGDVWSRYRLRDGTWQVESLGVLNLNKGHENAITADGVVLQTQGDVGWEGYRLRQSDARGPLLLGTDTSHKVAVVGVGDERVVVSQMRRGGSPLTREPVLLYRLGQTETVAEFAAEPPTCALSESRCATTASRPILRALTPLGEPVVVRQALQVSYEHACLEYAPTQDYSMRDVPPVRLCLVLGGWANVPTIVSVLSESLWVGQERLPTSVVPPQDDISMAWANDRLHLAWYEETPEGTQIRYIRARR